VRKGKGELRKELAAVKEEMRGREEKWQVEEADVITGIGGIRGNIKKGWKNG
jgi:hypothetical protein